MGQKSRKIKVLTVIVAVAAMIGIGIYAYIESSIPDLPSVAHAWASTGTEYANTDSVAACRVGSQVRVFATAKWGERIDVFDGATGRFIESFGEAGKGPGQLTRPNGIAVVRLDSNNVANDKITALPTSNQSRNIVVVVERDSGRVQMFDSETHQSLGIIGDGVLTRPYGAAVSYATGTPRLFVTDSGVTPEKTVSIFEISRTTDGIDAKLVRRFGDLDAGRIRIPESIVVDDQLGRVLLCDEDRSQRDVKIYQLDGTYTGKSFGGGIIGGDPEGLVIVTDPRGDFVLVTDQRAKITIWHAFDRATYEHLASITGRPRIRNTDGICIFEESFATFTRGALFAVNNDEDVRAYDLSTIADRVHSAKRTD